MKSFLSYYYSSEFAFPEIDPVQLATIAGTLVGQRDDPHYTMRFAAEDALRLLFDNPDIDPATIFADASSLFALRQRTNHKRRVVSRRGRRIISRVPRKRGMVPAVRRYLPGNHAKVGFPLVFECRRVLAEQRETFNICRERLAHAKESEALVGPGGEISFAKAMRSLGIKKPKQEFDFVTSLIRRSEMFRKRMEYAETKIPSVREVEKLITRYRKTGMSLLEFDDMRRARKDHVDYGKALRASKGGKAKARKNNLYVEAVARKKAPRKSNSPSSDL